MLKIFAKWNYPVVSVVHLRGLIMGGSKYSKNRINIDNVQKVIEKAFAPKKLSAVCLRINSPGGSPVQSDLIASFIKEKAEERPEVKLVSFAEDHALSGGYWLLCAGNEVYINQCSLVGSIGAIIASFGLDNFIKRYGIERRVLTAGKNKSFMDPFVQMNEDERARLICILGDIHEPFKNHVRGSRGSKLIKDEEALFNGEFWCGQKAVELGLADGINNVNSWIKTNYGSNVNVKQLSIESNPFASLFGSKSGLITEELLDIQSMTLK